MKTELMFLERVHRKIPRTIQGLPTRCPSSSLITLMGAQSVDMLIQQRSLGYIVVTANLLPEYIARRVLVARASSSSVKGEVKRFQDILAKHSLPDLSTLLSNTPSSNVWKSHVCKYLVLKAYLEFLEECDAYHLSSCSLKLLKLDPHWAAMFKDVKVMRPNNLRIRLLMGCDGLENDASRFRIRNTGGRVHDPSSKLCGTVSEDAAHFICNCSALAEVRAALLLAAPPTLSSLIPDPSASPVEFTAVMLGT